MDGIGDTKANLAAAVNGETYEFTKMYPGFITEAETEGHKKAKWSFGVANQVEEIHAGLFKEAIAAMSKDTGKDYYVCPVCGHTHARSAPDRCPVCGTAGTRFEKIN